MCCNFLYFVQYTSFVYHSPEGKQCIPFGNAIESIYGQIYYWLSLIINFAIPFVLLLIMNSFIIHKIRTRSTLLKSGQKVKVMAKAKVKVQRLRALRCRFYVILLLVTFGFLILMTPSYVLFVYVMFVDYQTSAQTYAGYILFHSVAQKTLLHHYGINFFLYVISGQKFRNDLAKLFRWNSDKQTDTLLSQTNISIISNS